MNFLTDPFLVPAGRLDGPVLVTGAAGCIGAWVLAILSRSGVSCVAADLTSDRTRPALVMGQEASADLAWETVDVTDWARVSEVVRTHGIHAIIHLAGLQVPFCAADPARGARVNVEGTVNILQAAREAGIKRLAYASSVAALAFPARGEFKETLYGAYKTANEQTAYVYWSDWQVPSVGIRPNVVFGVARDQGMTSLSTVAIQAAALRMPYEIPVSGPYSWLYAGEAAAAFIAAVSQPGDGAPVFNLNGRCALIDEGLAVLRRLAPNNEITASGAPLPFPTDLDESPIRGHLPEYPEVSLETGIEATYRAFRQLSEEGRLTALPG